MKLLDQVTFGPKKWLTLPLPTVVPSRLMTHDEELRVIVHRYSPGVAGALHADESELLVVNTRASNLSEPPER